MRSSNVRYVKTKHWFHLILTVCQSPIYIFPVCQLIPTNYMYRHTHTHTHTLQYNIKPTPLKGEAIAYILKPLYIWTTGLWEKHQVVSFWENTCSGGCKKNLSWLLGLTAVVLEKISKCFQWYEMLYKIKKLYVSEREHRIPSKVRMKFYVT